MNKTQDMIPVSVAMPPDMAQAARVEAAMRGISRSRFIRDAVKRVLAEDSQRDAQPQKED